MDLDPSESQYLKQKAETLRSLTTSSFSSAISNLTASSRAIPSNKDFHFFYNFDEFKTPVKDVISRSQSMLKDIGSASDIWGKQISFPEDMEDAYVWLVNVNDEVLERFDVSVDEFQRERKKEEEFGRQKMSFMMEDADSGFQQVYGKKKKGVSKFASAKGKSEGPESAVKVASGAKQANGTKPRVPFHIPTIKKPQDQFNIMVNNSNQPFEHVWLKRSEDGFRFVHPLESHSASDFVERNVRDVEPVKPLPMESVPFKLVQEVKDLKDLAAKLRSVNEFSVDLEHNQYRSFQGLTCLMQISTRNEDFVVDTLKLRIHIGPYLREVFKDPSKRKVMHGADRDVLWLQRDFGIYICNLFDTGQASRVLQLERKSLEYLLDHLCGVSAKKEYQNADWRLRPLPDEMLRYAREDTHYLLYIYDLLKARLLLESIGSENSEDLLAEVYARSYDICMQLYEKELLSDTSYLHIYGLQAANFNAQQLAIVAGLCEWRDGVARAEDESTGYILPNKILLEIAKQMPMTVGKLRGLVKYKHPYVEHSLGSVVNIIRHSIKNAAAFESVAKQLMEGQMQVVSRMQASAETVTVGTEASPLVPDSMDLIGDKTKKSSDVSHVRGPEETLTDSMELASTGQVKNGLNSQLSGFPSDRLTANGQIRISREDQFVQLPEKVNGATIEVQKKPSRAFGALFGKAALKRKSDPFKKEDQDKRLEQIKASVNLPFHLFPVKKEELSKSVSEEPTTTFEVPREDNLKANGKLEEIILLEGDSGSEEKESVDRNSESTKDKDGSTRATALEIDDEDEPMSLSDLSSSFESCFRSISQQRKGRQVKNNRPQQPASLLQIKPFDYAAALRFGEDLEGPSGAGRKGSVDGRDRPASRRGGAAAAGLRKEDASGELPQGRRRHAFPASGNRCATFR